MAEAPITDRFQLIAAIISHQITLDNGVRKDHLAKHGIPHFGATTREQYEAQIVELLKNPTTVGVWSDNNQWTFKGYVTGPDGKRLPAIAIINQDAKGLIDGTVYVPDKNVNEKFDGLLKDLGKKTSPVKGGLEALEANGSGQDIKRKQLQGLNNDAALERNAQRLTKTTGRAVVFAKLASAAGHVLKVVGPILAGVAIAAQSKAADAAVLDGRLPAGALLEYKALLSASVMGGVVDPTIVGSDIAANKAFTAFADHYGLDQQTREELNPSLSGALNSPVLNPEQQKFVDTYQALPSVTDPSYTPEINRMIELKATVETLYAQNGKPLGHLGTPEEMAAAQNRVDVLSGVESLLGDAYLAGRNNPQVAAQMDKLAANGQQVRDLAATGALRDEAGKLYDSLPAEAPANADPATKRLIAARNALRDRIDQLQGAEQKDNAAGHPVAGYYGMLNDQAYQQFYEALAREKLPAEPQAATPTASLDKLTPHRPNVASLSTAAAAATTDPTHPQVDPAKIPPKITPNSFGHAAGPV